MNGWYTTKELNRGNALFIMNNNPMKVSIKSVEKYEDVLRKLFGPEEGEDDGKPREDPSGFNGVLPM